jgi:hypothetical protein
MSGFMMAGMSPSFCNSVLCTLLLVMGTRCAVADPNVQLVGSTPAEVPGDAHFLSAPSNRFSSLLDKGSAPVSAFLARVRPSTRTIAQDERSIGNVAVTRATLSTTMSLQFRQGGVEDTVQHFHREGLPVARLWQGESSALNLGLNPKGKPGLWFVKMLP